MINEGSSTNEKEILINHSCLDGSKKIRSQFLFQNFETGEIITSQKNNPWEAPYCFRKIYVWDLWRRNYYPIKLIKSDAYCNKLKCYVEIKSEPNQRFTEPGKIATKSQFYKMMESYKDHNKWNDILEDRYEKINNFVDPNEIAKNCGSKYIYSQVGTFDINDCEFKFVKTYRSPGKFENGKKMPKIYRIEIYWNIKNINNNE